MYSIARQAGPQPPVPTQGQGLDESRPTGSAAATLIAAGVGCTVFGLAVVISEANKAVSTALTLSQPVGPLSGKVTIGVGGYLLSWLVLHLVLRRRDVDMKPVVWWTAALTAVGVLLTFPPVFDLFKP
jgi:hypothetical protein